jgi:hypothetical protein
MSLEEEYQLFKDERDYLLQHHYGEWVVIVGHRMVGYYHTWEDAILDNRRKYGLGKFLVQHCTEAEYEPVILYKE